MIHEHEELTLPDEARPEPRILGMNLQARPVPAVGTALRERIEAIAQAIRDKNVGLLMTFYAPEVVAFDLHPPRDVHGAAAYRQNFERWFESFEGKLGFDHVDLTITPGDTVAFCHYLAIVTGARPGGRKSGYWVRGTTCLEQRDGQWLVTHEHISMPASM